MYQRRATDPSYCACCATDFLPHQLVWAGLVYDTSVMVCNLRCLHTLMQRWAPTRWGLRTAGRAVKRAWAQWRRAA